MCLGEGLEEGFRLLSSRGRFLEIGKRDIYQNSRIGMQPFAQNVSFTAVAMDGLFDRLMLFLPVLCIFV